MFDVVTIVSGHIIIGGIAANLLVIFGLLSVAFGGEGSCVSPARRLPQDSDAKLVGLLFGVGAVCGVLFAYLSGFAVDWTWIAPTGFVSFMLGSFLAFSRVSKLNEQYLSRAQANFDQGRYKQAIEDANEVARSSERLRSAAKKIVAVAREQRCSQLPNKSLSEPLEQAISPPFDDEGSLSEATTGLSTSALLHN